MTDPLPPLFGEDYCFALLLGMVLEHCGTMNAGELDSFAVEAHVDAMQALADAGFLEIIQKTDGRLRATILPEAHALLAQFAAEKAAGRG